MPKSKPWLALALAGTLLSGGPAWANLPAAAAEGWRLELVSKSPQILVPLGQDSPRDGQPASALFAARDACRYAGLTAIWRSSSRTLVVERLDGSNQWTLVLGEAWLSGSGRRIALSSPLALASGAPALNKDSLKLLLEALSAQPPAWGVASPEELQAAWASMAPQANAADPLLVEPSPVVVAPPGALPTPGPTKRGPMRTVVIDAGHGGHDPGAVGKRGTEEKESCLDIAKRLQRELNRRAPDLKVLLTRDKDEFISLRQRAEFANKHDADLFISIHNNASRNRSSRGTQVFFYDSVASDKAAGDLARRENDDANYIDITMMDLHKQAVRDPSISLASQVQAELGKTLHLKFRTLSFAPFYVLARTKMPAILVEVAFITNPNEEFLLSSLPKRQQIAESIATGVLSYKGQTVLGSRR